MDHFHYVGDELHAEEISVSAITQAVGTPCYIYSRATLERHWHAFNDAFGNYPHLICYAVKANSNLGVLNILARMGSGFDVVSQGELERVIKAGGEPAKIIFSGVGKTKSEIKRALKLKIDCFNVESAAELDAIIEVATELNCVAPIAFRINPDVDAKTHPYISTGLKENKFGITIPMARKLYHHAKGFSCLKIKGITCHIGSQLLELSPFLDALKHLLALIEELKQEGIELTHLDFGGGLGVRYQDENPPHPTDYAKAILKILQDHNSQLKILLEPGRAIAANAGILVTEVLYLKEEAHKSFAIVDAAMNDLLRPALYQAQQAVWPIVKSQAQTPDNIRPYDIVGPVCETGDFLAKNCALSIKPKDLLAIRTTGAYGFVMSSNYNSRPRVPEVIVDGKNYYVVRTRETFESLYANETILPSN